MSAGTVGFWSCYGVVSTIHTTYTEECRQTKMEWYVAGSEYKKGMRECKNTRNDVQSLITS